MVLLRKMSHKQLNYAFWCVETHLQKVTENFSLGSKKYLPPKEAKNYSESYIFSTCLIKGTKYFDSIETTFFPQTREIGQILMKMVFLIKMSYIRLN